MTGQVAVSTNRCEVGTSEGLDMIGNAIAPADRYDGRVRYVRTHPHSDGTFELLR